MLHESYRAVTGHELLVRLPDFTSFIPPLLRRNSENKWMYPQLHDGSLTPPDTRSPASVSSAGGGDTSNGMVGDGLPPERASPASLPLNPISDGSSGHKSGTTLSSALSYKPASAEDLLADPLARLELVSQMQKVEPPKLRQLSAWEVERKEKARLRILKMHNKRLAKEHARDMPLEGRAALRHIFGEDEDK